MDSLKKQIIAFGDIYKNAPDLYGVYVQAQQLAHNPNVSQFDFDQFQLKEPLREEMVNYGKQFTGYTSQYDAEIPTLERELDRINNMPADQQDQEAIKLLKRQLNQARDRDYESNTLIETGFLNQYGDYDRGDYQDGKLAQYQEVLGFIRELNAAQSEYDVNTVRIRFSIFKRDLLERRYNMLPGMAGKSKFVRSFRQGYRK